MKNKLIERLISYAKVDTQSNENSQTTPSTPGQLTLANMLVEELKEIGMKDVTIDENGYVMATLPSNTEKEVPTIGFHGSCGYSNRFYRKERQSAGYRTIRRKGHCAE